VRFASEGSGQICLGGILDEDDVIAKAAEDAGSDALSLINTVFGVELLFTISITFRIVENFRLKHNPNRLTQTGLLMVLLKLCIF